MRKTILLLLLALPILVLSQNKKKKGFYKWDVGINGGINFNNPLINSDPGNSIDSSLNDINFRGNLYGLTLIYHVNRFVAIKGEFDIENRGWKNDFNVSDDINVPDFREVTQVLDYFDIPLFMHLGFGKKFKVDLNFGPYFGFKIKDEVYSINENGEQIEGDDVRGMIELQEFKNFDLGLVYGIGFDYYFHERISIGFDALYERGMRVINEKGYRNSSIDFDFGLNFQLGKKKK
tara:strand:+ start:6383 stop:7084 length:702 start_codon:yes stop_codon:yes gene_type:complete